MKKRHHPIIIALIVILAIISIVLLLISFNFHNKPIEPSIINLQESHPINNDIVSKTNFITTASIDIPEKSNIYVSSFVSVIIILVIVSVLLLIIRRK